MKKDNVQNISEKLNKLREDIDKEAQTSFKSQNFCIPRNKSKDFILQADALEKEAKLLNVPFVFNVREFLDDKDDSLYEYLNESSSSSWDEEDED